MTQAPFLTVGTSIDGFTLGQVIRTRTGAVTYMGQGADAAHVEITVYSPECFPSALVRERSLRELRQLAGVHSPSLVRVLHAGKTDDGGIYEVTEPVAGTSLEKVGALPKTRVGQILAHVGEALLAGQNVGVIHRNLGPNVIFEAGNAIKVLGYAVGEPQGAGAFGPLDTISPEQATGKVVDQRSLVYNLAALAAMLLNGRPLFGGSQAEKLEAHANQPLPSDLDPLFAKGLAKDARMRPMMLKQYVAELAALSPAPAVAAPAAPAADAQPTTRGWTQFMEADDTAAPASSDATSPAAAPAAPEAGRPSTRGWTMFMEASDAEPEEKSAAAPPAQPAPAAAPTTRGWTMFMEAGDDGSASAPSAASVPANPAIAPPPAFDLPDIGPAQPLGVPLAAPPVAPTVAPPVAPPVAPNINPTPVGGPAKPIAPNFAPPVTAPVVPGSPAPAAAGTKPSTRGWTLFMDAAPSSTPSAGTDSQPPTSPSTPAPIAVPPVAAPAPAASQPVPAPAAAPAFTPAAPAKPLFTPTARTPVAPLSPLNPNPIVPQRAANPVPSTPTAAQPAAPVPTSGQRPAPSTRGWTLFMDAPLPKSSSATTSKPAVEASSDLTASQESPNTAANFANSVGTAADSVTPAAGGTMPLPQVKPIASDVHASIAAPSPSFAPLSDAASTAAADLGPALPSVRPASTVEPSMASPSQYSAEPQPIGVRANTVSIETNAGWTGPRIAAAVIVGGLLIGAIAAGVFYMLP
jgi:hypothetical protein